MLHRGVRSFFAVLVVLFSATPLLAGEPQTSKPKEYPWHRRPFAGWRGNSTRQSPM